MKAFPFPPRAVSGRPRPPGAGLGGDGKAERFRDHTRARRPEVDGYRGSPRSHERGYGEKPTADRRSDGYRGGPRSYERGYGAFSLIELLVVLAVIGILAVLVTGSIRGLSNSTDMTRASEDVANVVTLAAQRAATFNRQTAVRFLSQTSTGPYVAYQYWEQVDSANQGSWQPVEPIRMLPPDVVVTNNNTFSTFLTRTNVTGTFTASTGTVWNYAQIYFAPDGSLVASTGQTSITLVGSTSNSSTATSLPPNFAVVDIAPIHSIATIYRPQ